MTMTMTMTITTATDSDTTRKPKTASLAFEASWSPAAIGASLRPAPHAAASSVPSQLANAEYTIRTTAVMPQAWGSWRYLACCGDTSTSAGLVDTLGDNRSDAPAHNAAGRLALSGRAYDGSVGS